MNNSGKEMSINSDKLDLMTDENLTADKGRLCRIQGSRVGLNGKLAFRHLCAR